MDLGVCLNDEAFEPFLDGIIDNEDFSNCYELYLRKRYDGRKEACEQYEEPEIIEIPEGEDIMVYLHIEHMKQSYRFTDAEYTYCLFDRFTIQKGGTEIGITKEMADRWAVKRPNESDASATGGLCSGYDSYIPRLPRAYKSTFTPCIS